MEIRRKVFSILQDKDGEERYFSTTDYTLEEKDYSVVGLLRRGKKAIQRAGENLAARAKFATTETTGNPIKVKSLEKGRIPSYSRGTEVLATPKNRLEYLKTVEKDAKKASSSWNGSEGKEIAKKNEKKCIIRV